MKQYPSELLLERVHSNRQAYAQSYAESAKVYESNDVYKMMRSFVGLIQGAMQSRWEIPEDRPIVHIDIGSGTGHLLGALAARYRELNRKFCLIGVDVNDLLAQYSVERLRSQGNRVMEHIHAKEKVETVKGNLIYRRSFPLNEKTIDEMPVNADDSIVIIQDDARKELRILMAVLRKLRMQGVEHVDSISLSLPGTGTDLVLQDSTALNLSDRHLVTTGAGKVIQEVLKRTCTLAYEVLGIGGAFIPIQRLHAQKVVDYYQERTGEQLPLDPNEKLLAKGCVAQLMLGIDAYKFHLRSAAVLMDEFRKVESQASMQFASVSAAGSSIETEAIDDMELFAIGLVRSDLHKPGNKAYQVSMTTPNANEDQKKVT